MTEGKDASTGRFLPGNRFWEARSSHGRNPQFTNPDDLWAACCEYFEWVADNPLHEAKLVSFQGASTQEALPKLRAMTIAALCMFLDIDVKTWRNWRDERSDLLPVITRAEAVIYQQKFEGASADLLNPNIIARDLGLADRQEHTGKGGGPIQTEEVSARDRIAGQLARLASAGGEGEDTGGSE